MDGLEAADGAVVLADTTHELVVVSHLISAARPVRFFICAKLIQFESSSSKLSPLAELQCTAAALLRMVDGCDETGASAYKLLPHVNTEHGCYPRCTGVAE